MSGLGLATTRGNENAKNTANLRNSWFFKRDTENGVIIVTANYIGRQSVWSMNCKVNGELVDAHLADDPWDAARKMIDAAILGDDSTDVTVTVTEAEDTPPRVDA